MSLPDDLLDRPAEEAVRRIALGQIERADAARAALVAGEDPEALHDFRVAVRRLRSHLRAFRDEVGDTLGRKLRRRLKKLADATNPGRDAEVGLAWLDALGGAGRPAEKHGLDWLHARLVERRDRAYRAVTEEVVGQFGELAERLHERLSHYRVDCRLDQESPERQPFAAALAVELERHQVSLAEALARVVSVADEREAHAARIEAKRLRYLLEPVAGLVPGGRVTVERLKSLQDRLGELHDLQLLAAEVAQGVADAEGERARRVAAAALAGDPDGRRQRAAMRRSERPGLLALARRIAARRDQIFAACESEWLGDAVAARDLEAEIAALLAWLSRSAPPA